MQISDIKKNADLKMHATIEALKGSLGKVRTGRANPALLDTVHVDYYGAMLPLSQVANLSPVSYTHLTLPTSDLV